MAGACRRTTLNGWLQLDARWAEGHEILKRFGRAFRDQTAEEIEEAVAQAVAEVRAENRRGVGALTSGRAIWIVALSDSPGVNAW